VTGPATTATRPREAVDLALRAEYAFRSDDSRAELSLRSGSTPHVATALSDPAVVDDAYRAWWTGFLRGGPDVGARPESPRNGLRVLDLFSSVGGLSLGFSQAAALFGLPIRMHVGVDQDPHALEVFGRRFCRDGFTVHRSVADLVDSRISGVGPRARFAYEPEIDDQRLADAGPIDVLLAGPPCQGHSSLNNHTRGNDPKNRLYLKVPAIAVALGVRVVIIENVPNVVRDADSVVATTVALLEQAGYGVTRDVLAAHHLGWPQTRKRYFIVALKGEDPLSLRDVIRPAWAHAANPSQWPLDLAKQWFDDSDPLSRPTEHSEANRRRIEVLFEEGLNGLPLDERPDCHRNGTSYSASYGRMHADQPAPTITSGFTSPGRGRFVHPHERRTLTPREAALIQGFPADYPFITGKEPPTRSLLGKWIGDAVPPILGMIAASAALARSLPGLVDPSPRLEMLPTP